MVEEGCRPLTDVGLELEKLARFMHAVVDLDEVHIGFVVPFWGHFLGHFLGTHWNPSKHLLNFPETL